MKIFEVVTGPPPKKKLKENNKKSLKVSKFPYKMKTSGIKNP